MIPRKPHPSPCLATLDRIAWVDGLAVESHGVSIGVRSDDRTLLAALADRLTPSLVRVEREEVQRVYSLLCGGPDLRRRGVTRLHLGFYGAALVARTRSADALVDAISSDLHRCIAETTTAWTFVHAGAVAIGDAALLLPGRSMAGKSTLVHALLAEGARYLSDEYAVLDAAGRVHPYDKPISLRLAEGGRRAVTPAELGATTPAAPLPVRWVVATAYRPEGRFRPRALTPGQTALALLANTVRARSRPDASLAAVTQACRDARGLQSVRGDARATARMLIAAAREELCDGAAAGGA